jgi:hypothetical protein
MVIGLTKGTRVISGASQAALGNDTTFPSEGSLDAIKKDDKSAAYHWFYDDWQSLDNKNWLHSVQVTTPVLFQFGTDGSCTTKFPLWLESCTMSIKNTANAHGWIKANWSDLKPAYDETDANHSATVPFHIWKAP